MKTSLPKQSSHVSEHLAAITAVLNDLIGNDLVMLLLFGPYAKGDYVCAPFIEGGSIYFCESGLDLLVVTENRRYATSNGKAQLFNAATRRLRRLGLNRPSSTLFVKDIKHLNKDIRRGNYFFTDITDEGVLLFDSGRHELADACPIDPIKRKQRTQADFDAWYASACGFLKMYKTAMRIGDNNIAAFQLHQATERFLNTIVLAFANYKPRTHDLGILDRQACNLHPSLFAVFPRADKEQQRCFDLLKEAYIGARYKQDFIVTKEELEYLASRIRKLQRITQRICKKRIADMA